jgi:glucosamine kinase
MENVVRMELLGQINSQTPESVYFYGTGCKNPNNAKKVRSVLKAVFRQSDVEVDHDLTGAARALCQNEKGIVCILGTGSNSCYYNGSKIVKNSPGLGYVLGDEGSGAYLGKKVIQYYLYETFEKELAEKFAEKYRLTVEDILENVYSKPLPNRYLASFTEFLAENRGHYMIENIIEDGLNDFFSNHITKYSETKKYPVHFTGGVAHYFRDVVEALCSSYGLQLGNILKNPMDGLIKYHKIAS